MTAWRHSQRAPPARRCDVGRFGETSRAAVIGRSVASDTDRPARPSAGSGRTRPGSTATSRSGGR